MTVFLQQLINGISLGSVYALFALGFTLIFGVLEIINLAHAAILAVGALLAYTLFTSLGAGLVIALLGASIGTGVLGVVIDVVKMDINKGLSDDKFVLKQPEGSATQTIGEAAAPPGRPAPPKERQP